MEFIDTRGSRRTSPGKICACYELPTCLVSREGAWVSLCFAATALVIDLNSAPTVEPPRRDLRSGYTPGFSCNYQPRSGCCKGGRCVGCRLVQGYLYTSFVCLRFKRSHPHPTRYILRRVVGSSSPSIPPISHVPPPHQRQATAIELEYSQR